MDALQNQTDRSTAEKPMLASLMKWSVPTAKFILRAYILTVAILVHLIAGGCIVSCISSPPYHEMRGDAQFAFGVGNYLLDVYPQRESNFRALTQWMNYLSPHYKKRLNQNLAKRILGPPDAEEGAKGNVTLRYDSTDSCISTSVIFRGGLLVRTREELRPENFEPVTP